MLESVLGLQCFRHSLGVEGYIRIFEDLLGWVWRSFGTSLLFSLTGRLQYARLGVFGGGFVILTLFYFGLYFYSNTLQRLKR